jgi:hypothetical protein
MRRFGLMLLLVFAFSISALAQGGSGYFAVLPGYQFGSGDTDSGFVTSLDGGYFYNDNWALHMGLNYNEGKFDFGEVLLPTNPPTLWDLKYKDSFYIFELGPELAGNLGKGQIYGQFNVGHTFGAESNEWTYGAALGYRYPINDKVGVNVQTTYHRVNDWDTDHLDVRLGLVFRF